MYIMEPFYSEALCYGIPQKFLPAKPWSYFPNVSYQGIELINGVPVDNFESVYSFHKTDKNLTFHIHYNYFLKEDTNIPVRTYLHLHTIGSGKSKSGQFVPIEFMSNVTMNYSQYNTRVPDSAFGPKPNQPCKMFEAPSSGKFDQQDHARLAFERFHVMGHDLESLIQYAEDATTVLNTKERIEEIQSKASWTVGESDFETSADLEVSLMNTLPLRLELPKQESEENISIPDHFDARLKWKNCIKPARNQASCGSCYSFGAAETFGDRLCIASNGRFNKQMSPQSLVSCEPDANGCGGGFVDNVARYVRDVGMATEECMPYVSGHGQVPKCSNKCVDGSSVRRYRTYNAYTTGSNVEAIQKEILKNGPVEVAYWVFDDFPHYKGGVYARTPESSLKGGHAVAVYGWGFEDNTPYWLVKNSWGVDWPAKSAGGFFKIRRGTNECGIEDQVSTGIPMPVHDL
eukprot:TRINITY_DN1750_c0_g1_i2.p1 TRINITY_DN1750_c0_g1~~TRINITY_DN1750_c0_g1_i2.p1  ORF type:complete len:512 (-),score=157.61 TRINITY_DN1750_c0_g1_i2:995-2374(-)